MIYRHGASRSPTDGRPLAVVMHPSDEGYGADRILLEICETLRGDGYGVVIVLPTDMSYAQSNNISPHLLERGFSIRWADIPVLRRAYLRRPTDLLRLARRVRTLPRLIDELHPDLLYLNTSAVVLALASVRNRVPHVVLHVHEAWRPVERQVLGGLARHASRVVCVSRDTWKRLPRRLRSRSAVVQNGLDESVDLDSIPGVGSVKPSLCVLMASRWNRWKGHEYLLKAFAEVSPGQIRLVILGGPPRSGHGVDVTNLVRNHVHSEHICVVGEVADVQPYLLDADVVVVPSTSPDPFPTIALEAMRLGRPVIASHIGGLPEIVEPGVTGWLVNPQSPSDLARQLRELDRASLERMGAEAHARYSANFTGEAFRGRLSAALQHGKPG